MAARISATYNSLRTYAILGVSALALTACASSGDNLAKSNAEYEDAIGTFTSPASQPSQMDPVAAAAFWGTRYNRDHNDMTAAANYSKALRKIGSVDEAVNVSTTAARKDAGNADVHLEAGKSLVEAGRAFEAVRHLEIAAASKTKDWTALSAYGVALDNIGEHELARDKYNKALLVAPGSSHVMNNIGLSYALSGDLSQAEATLRTAAGAPGADARVRQNLALVLALKGDMSEAERLARSDLPPQVANNNIQYFRSLMNQPAYWAQYSPDNFDAPDFKPAPAKTKVYTPPKPEKAPLPKLQEKPKAAPKPKEEPSNQPIAMTPATPVTNASAVVEEDAPERLVIQDASSQTAPEEPINNQQDTALPPATLVTPASSEPVQLAPAPELKSDN